MTSFLCVHLNLRGRPDSDDRPSVPTPSPLGWPTLVSFGLQKRKITQYRLLKSLSLVSWTFCCVKKKEKRTRFSFQQQFTNTSGSDCGATAAPLRFQELFVFPLWYVAVLQNKNPPINVNTSDFQDKGWLSGTATCSC